MRHLLIVFVILMSLVAFPSWSETKDDLIKRNGLFYKKFTDLPFSGEVEGKWQGLFKNGKPEGSWVLFYDTGQVQMKDQYNNGLRQGPHESYFANGQLWSKGHFANGQREGYWQGYNEDGTVFDPGTGIFKYGEKISN